MVNRVVLVGRLTRDPETRTTNTGKSVSEFSLAVTKRFKPQDGSPDADFIRIKAWGSQADYVSKYLTKGRLVAIDGRLDQRRYQASDGTNREVIEVVAENVQGLDRPRDDERSMEPAAVVAGGPATSEDEYDPFADE